MSAGDRAATCAELQLLARGLRGDATAAGRRDFLIAFARSHGLPVPELPNIRALPALSPGDPVEACTPAIAPGLSVVTCCRNRTGNLLRALPSWLALAQVDEVVVVDWTSDTPVAEALAQAGLSDPRILVVRVEDEPRWILTYAFNLGFRVAGFDTILKTDADIVLGPDFPDRNRLEPGCFIAGNWRTAPQGQEYLNGFFMIARDALMGVGGFNEFIHSYGWDDEDIYTRIEATGLVRRDVDVDTVHHLPHDDAARTGGTGGACVTAADTLPRDPRFLIRANRFVANVMPAWRGGMPFLPFVVRAVPDGGVADHGARVITLSRQGWEPSAVPDTVQADARHYAALELLSWQLGRAAMGLDRDRCARLLRARTQEALTKLDLEIALGNAPQVLEAPGRRLVIALEGGVPAGSPTEGLVALAEMAAARGLVPVLSGPFAALPRGLSEPLYRLPFVPGWHDIGTPEAVTLETLRSGPPEMLAARGGADLRIAVPKDALAGLGAALAAPAVARQRPVLYVDAQHGMGNRLRAIGSAAAIASHADRALVIVWQPDHHCDCRLGDLFDYSGPVLESAFVDDAATRGIEVYNYMPVEPGSRKDAEIDLASPRDIYVRSAFVLNAGGVGGDWDAQNRFLQALRPVEAVRDLVAAVRHPNALAAHVRMEAGAGRDNQSYDRPDNWTDQDHALIHHWRAQSHFTRFMERIDALIAQGAADTLFLAADLPEIYDAFSDRYADRLAFLPRDIYDRSAEQLRYGLADAILLGRAPRLLGSTWSSFSELATRLAPAPVVVEMSGTDF
ncbi:galactosyltransferase-related protein [Rhodobaculum claviforme]|uniref:Uncharacterized protein n=1 Tax=Rhodobaculum claviforme TaxID=1549854 RepID=A0A934WJZ4_9RHOB|nr:galactosyltransferase-related protein [Rhodobaculum claviforme]MBK5928442.1 hypothetical protein [Rhodobaculum claviforme]